MREDYYQLLNVEPTASKQELRAAYRHMAMRYHPDHNADDPWAEEQFKLVADAWRTLGDDEKRADYDAWLERHRRFAHLPEMESMSKRRSSRMSVRGDLASHRRRSEERTYRRPVRPFLLKRTTRVSGLHFVLISLCGLMAMLPFIRHQFAMADRAPVARSEEMSPKLPPGESPLTPEEQMRELENYRRRLLTAAEAGDATAQYSYGFVLYMGLAGAEKDKVEARRWWEKSAAQGNELAIKVLASMKEAPASPGEGADDGASTEPPEP